VLSDLFYQLGSAVGALGSQLPGKAGAAATGYGPASVYDPDTGDIHDLDEPEPFGTPGDLVRTAAAGWLLSRVLRPRPVRWTRVILAGVAATLLADLAARYLDPDARPAPSPADDPEAMLRRYGAGIGLAAGYAALLYPRLPGPPLLRGLAVGALGAASAPRGGLAGLAADLPALRFPLQGLTVADADRPTTPLSALAFGLALGVFYGDEREG
jgi:hypothetical protein